MHSNRLLSPLNHLATLLKRNRLRTLSALAELPPLDPVERLQHNGSTFPVVMEFSRLGW